MPKQKQQTTKSVWWDGEKVEAAILVYQTSDPDARSRIYEQFLDKPFREIARQIIVLKRIRYPHLRRVAVYELIDAVIERLVTHTIFHFDPKKGSAYSFLNASIRFFLNSYADQSNKKAQAIANEALLVDDDNSAASIGTLAQSTYSIEDKINYEELKHIILDELYQYVAENRKPRPGPRRPKNDDFQTTKIALGMIELISNDDELGMNSKSFALTLKNRAGGIKCSKQFFGKTLNMLRARIAKRVQAYYAE